MLEVRELFDSMSVGVAVDRDRWSEALTALSACQEATTSCAASMAMLEGGLGGATLRDLDCADVVQATMRVLGRATDIDQRLLSAQLEACLVACDRSHEQCAGHADEHAHCRICADATKECADACRNLLATITR